MIVVKTDSSVRSHVFTELTCFKQTKILFEHVLESTLTVNGLKQDRKARKTFIHSTGV